MPTRKNNFFHDVDVSYAKPKQHPYRCNPVKQHFLKEEIQYLLENDFIEPSHSEWSSPDYGKVNNCTKMDTIPRIDDCIDKIGRSKSVSKFDLLNGFWQIPFSEKAKEISAFVTPDGHL